MRGDAATRPLHHPSMKGTRPLTNEEIRKVRDAFEGTFAQRNRGLFMLGVSIGGRVSELLALTVGDVYQNNQPVTDFSLTERLSKEAKPVGRSLSIPMDARRLLKLSRGTAPTSVSCIPITRYSRPGKAMTAIKRQAIHKVLEAAFVKAGLNGKLATHTLRKTFAQRLYQQCNDIYLVRELLGHKNVVTTQAYIGINYVSAQDAVEAMSLDAEDTPRDPLDAFPPEQLIAKVIALGYEVRLRTEK